MLQMKRYKFINSHLLFHLLCLLIILNCTFGCQSQTTGPATTETSSSNLTYLSEKIEFLERYVTFRRNYQSLEFHINYHNNGSSLVPGPSDWDIRLMRKSLRPS